MASVYDLVCTPGSGRVCSHARYGSQLLDGKGQRNNAAVTPPRMSHSAQQQVTEYLKLMIPPNASYAKFTNARSKGKVIGPDGQQIFCIYGPHSAPTQHIAEYTVDMIIGAGIGVTVSRLGNGGCSGNL